MEFFHAEANPINFDNLEQADSDSSDLEREDSSDGTGASEGPEEEETGETWVSPPLQTKVEVPIWLMERFRQRSVVELPGEKAADHPDTPSRPENVESTPTAASTEDRRLEQSRRLEQTRRAEPTRRVSFQVETPDTSVLASRKSSRVSYSVPGGNFWKIPMPTRKNTIMIPLPNVEEEEEEEEQEHSDQTLAQGRHSLSSIEEEAESEEDEEHITVTALPRRNTMAYARSRRSTRFRGLAARRQSALSIFSDDQAKLPGLYVLPKDKEATGEVVEVKRQSLVMSASMLNDILAAKMEPDRFEELQNEAEDEFEVVMPFFSPPQNQARECKCKTDPVTGLVVHTCMTPAATQATNTAAMNSYICSAWGSRNGSRNMSFNPSRASKSRRESDEQLDRLERDADREIVAEDLRKHDVPPPPQPVVKRKRIRNASMLAIVGGKGPVAATKTEADESPPVENELAISFKNIQNAASPRSSHATIDSEVADTASSDPTVLFLQQGDQRGEERVECELSHRFELLEPYVLASMLKDPTVRETLLIVDVRGRDWVGGHIPSSINLRTSEVTAHPAALILQCRQNRIHHVVFTCMYSVLRARKSAVAVESAQEEERQAGNAPYRIRVSLLAGGMHAWVNHFMKNHKNMPPEALLDSFDPEMWSDGGPSQGGLVHVMDALWSSGGQKALSDALSQELQQLLIARRDSDSRRQSGTASTASGSGGKPQSQS